MCSRNLWLNPAPSTVIMRLRRYAGGSAAIAASVTVMWSAAVLLPAEPLRSIHASGSPPVLSHRGGGRRIPEDRAKLAHDRDVGHRGGTQRDRDRRGDQHHAPAELRFPALEDERRVQARVRPHWSASLRSRIPPAWPTRPSPPEATSRARSQDVSFIAKGAPIWKFLWCGNPKSSRTRTPFTVETAILAPHPPGAPAPRAPPGKRQQNTSSEQCQSG